MTLEDLTAFRKNRTFDKAWRDCIEIRRDYLIDAALAKRADPSFVKFLLSDEAGYSEPSSAEANTISVTVTVEDG